MVEEELEMVLIWLSHWDLLDNPNGKDLPPVPKLELPPVPKLELPPVWALYRFRVLWVLSASLETQLVKPCGAPSCTACCLVRTSLGPSR